GDCFSRQRDTAWFRPFPSAYAPIDLESLPRQGDDVAHGNIRHFSPKHIRRISNRNVQILTGNKIHIVYTNSPFHSGPETTTSAGDEYLTRCGIIADNPAVVLRNDLSKFFDR